MNVAYFLIKQDSDLDLLVQRNLMIVNVSYKEIGMFSKLDIICIQVKITFIASQCPF